VRGSAGSGSAAVAAVQVVLWCGVAGVHRQYVGVNAADVMRAGRRWLCVRVVWVRRVRGSVKRGGSARRAGA